MEKYCPDEGTEHDWHMFTEDGCLKVSCRCGAEAVRWAAEKTLELDHTPVRVVQPPPWDCCGTVTIKPRL